MGNIYVTCARCNKGMTIAEYNCVFCSDIDNQFVCADCFKKEQPKELMKQITDLEAKLDEKTRVAEGYSELFDKRQHENYEQFCEIQELKAKLAESEKAFDTICEKYEKKSKQIFETIKCQEECSDAYDLLSKENEKLKQQLAESESKARTYAKEIVFLDKQLKEKEKEETKRMEGFEKRCQEYYNSDEYKKDFAIAELEKVKKEFNGAFSISIQQKMFDKYINKQIKSLKGDADE